MATPHSPTAINGAWVARWVFYQLNKMVHTLYEVKYTGVCIKSLLSSKGIGYYRRKGQRYTEKEVIPLTGIEPTKQRFFELINVCQKYLDIDIASITWRKLSYTAS